MIPTNYFQYVRRDLAAPSLVLQQWWTDSTYAARSFIPPGANGWPGEWRDVPIAQQPPLHIYEDKTP